MTLEVIHDAPLQALHTFGVPATAAHLVQLRDRDDLPALQATLGRLTHEPASSLILGAGSNWLPVGDLQQPIVQVQLRGRRRLDDRGLIEVAAGEPWDDLVHWSLDQGLAGLENLALIPGTVGAAPIQNIGAYGVEIASCLEQVEAFHLLTGKTRFFDRAECALGYRDSLFKQAAGAHWLITSVRLRLVPEDQAVLHLDYGDVRHWLRETGIPAPRAHDVARAVRAIRRSKLPDPAVLGNAGSFFKNPIVSAQKAKALKTAYPAMPQWPLEGRGPVEPRDGGPSAGDAGDGAPPFKLAAAWLIDQCGWKGARHGQAGVHAAHALVLVNHGQASGADVLALARQIQASVLSRFGVMLEPEPLIVG